MVVLHSDFRILNVARARVDGQNAYMLHASALTRSAWLIAKTGMVRGCPELVKAAQSISLLSKANLQPEKGLIWT